jgi:hypothetical protein
VPVSIQECPSKLIAKLDDHVIVQIQKLTTFLYTQRFREIPIDAMFITTICSSRMLLLSIRLTFIAIDPPAVSIHKKEQRATFGAAFIS